MTLLVIAVHSLMLAVALAAWAEAQVEGGDQAGAEAANQALAERAARWSKIVE